MNYGTDPDIPGHRLASVWNGFGSPRVEHPDFIAKLNKKPQFQENKITNLVDSVTEAIVKAANDERYVPSVEPQV